MVHQEVPVNLNQKIMKKVIILMLLSAAFTSLKAQIPQPDPDTTAKHFLIVASIGNLQEASAGQIAAMKAKHAGVK
jgi:putative membrane protein